MDNERPKRKPGLRLLAAALIALGLALSGWFIGRGFLQSRTADRFVTVKGVAERDVTADLALWPLRVVATSNQLGVAQRETDQMVTQIRQFLERRGLDGADVELQGLEVTDRRAGYGSGNFQEERFIVNQTVMVRSEDPSLVENAAQ